VGNRTLVQAGFALLVLTVAVWGCDRKKPPTAPTTPESPSSTPTSPSVPLPAPVVTRFTIDGPASVPPGQTAQYTATASFADGSTRDVTREAVWRAEANCCPVPSTPALTISNDGVATGLNPGEVFVYAFLGPSRSSFKNVLVLHAGTFRHHGFVDDAGVPVPDARVTVVEGSATGLATTTDLIGQYRLYGVSGPTDVAVTKPGYAEQKQELTVTGNHQSLTFHLSLSGPREDVGGTYTLTITAAAECASKLPAEARERTYQAVLTQTGARLTATLQGGTFYTSGTERYNTFDGAVETGGLRFFIAGVDYYDPFGHADVLDQLTASTYFSMGGRVMLTGTSARRSGSLDGAIEIFGAPPRYDFIASCMAKGHRVELTR
jgi:hypothetical protein